MSIRWKFLTIVLVFSIVPLLAVIALNQMGMLRLGETISELMDNILTRSAGAELAQTTAASAKVMALHLADIREDLRHAAQPSAAGASGFSLPVPTLSQEHVLRGSFRVGAPSAIPESMGSSGRPEEYLARPFHPGNSSRLAAVYSFSARAGEPEASPWVSVDIDLSALLEDSVLDSRWSIRMYAFLIRLGEAAAAGPSGWSIMAFRDSLADRGRWRPLSESEAISVAGSPAMRELWEHRRRRETGFLELPWNGMAALWAYAPVTPQLVLVTITPGMVVDVARDVLAFARWQWVDSAAASIMVLLLLVAVAWWRSKAMTASFHEMVQAVERLGRGDFSSRMPLGAGDEREQVARAFNEMVPQLEDRLRMRKALDVAREIQQTLLPPEDPDLPGFALAARSNYSDETGGDYFDYFPCGGPDGGRYGCVVGDVAGHGVGAALLMATARAFIRAAMEFPEGLAARIRRVNRLLTADTRHSGNFMSLFFLEIEAGSGLVRWVRAGHDPALLFDPDLGDFAELGGPGLVLGVDEDFVYVQQERTVNRAGTIVMLFTDGLWETHSPAGEPFGKDRLKTVVKAHAEDSAEEIRDRVLEAVAAFRGGLFLEDDVTLVVIKAH